MKEVEKKLAGTKTQRSTEKREQNPLRTECLKIHLYPCGLHSWFVATTWYTALQREIKNNMYVPHICPRHLIFDVCELRGISALIFFKFIRAMWQCTIHAFLNIIHETARLLISSHYGNIVSFIELTSLIHQILWLVIGIIQHKYIWTIQITFCYRYPIQ